MADWRTAFVEILRGQRLLRLKYTQPSEDWDHDHCTACNARFSEKMDGPEIQKEGYTTGPEYSHGREYDWICLRCFNDLKDEMGWTVGYSDQTPP